MSKSHRNMSSKKERFKLKVIIDSISSAFVEIRVYNGHREIVAKEHGSLDVSLTQGIYEIQATLGVSVKKELVQLIKDTEREITIEPQVSSTLFTGVDQQPIEIPDKVLRWSTKVTYTMDLDRDKDSSLFVLFKFPNGNFKDVFGRNALSGYHLHLLDSERKEIMVFNGKNVKVDHKNGWLAFHMEAPFGQYYFLFGGEQPREVPIFLFSRWQTQLAMVFGDRPIFESMEISFDRLGQGFDPKGYYHATLVTLIQNLQNGIYFLPRYLLEEISHGKWENPMLGIIGTYIYVFGGYDKEKYLFETIMGNLEREIFVNSNSPDLMALRCLFSDRSSTDAKELTFSAPCMVRYGMDAIVDASFNREGSIVIADQVQESIKQGFSDLIWTSYFPLPFWKEASKENRALESVEVDTDQRFLYDAFVHEESDELLALEILNRLKSREKFASRYRLGGMFETDTSKIAKDLNMTPKIVGDVVNKLIHKDGFLKKIEDKQMNAKLEFGTDFSNDSTRDLLNKFLKK